MNDQDDRPDSLDEDSFVLGVMWGARWLMRQAAEQYPRPWMPVASDERLEVVAREIFKSVTR